MTVKKWILILAVFFCTNSYGNVYKCVDAKGHTLLTDKACSTGSKSSQLIDESSKQETTTFPFFSEFVEKVINLVKSDSTDQSSNSKIPNDIPVSSNQQQMYRCDGRTYCSQMTSCEEATFFIKNCPDTKMDGDMDGIPCESQWCGH